jgi:hypothetical protein
MVQEMLNAEWKYVVLSDVGRWKLHGSEINIKNDMSVLHTNTHSSEIVYSTLQHSVV